MGRPSQCHCYCPRQELESCKAQAAQAASDFKERGWVCLKGEHGLESGENISKSLRFCQFGAWCSIVCIAFWPRFRLIVKACQIAERWVKPRAPLWVISKTSVPRSSPTTHVGQVVSNGYGLWTVDTMGRIRLALRHSGLGNGTALFHSVTGWQLMGRSFHTNFTVGFKTSLLCHVYLISFDVIEMCRRVSSEKDLDLGSLGFGVYQDQSGPLLV